MSDALANTLHRVRERVTPSPDEIDELEVVIEELVERTETAVAEREIEADVLRVGSTARGTWLPGERDIDIFVRFAPRYDREILEDVGVEIGRAVLPSGRLEYAEHPYVTAEYDGYSVDLVPCFRVDSGAEIRSAVDRTPFHATYVQERLDETRATDVRVLKQFLRATGVYGSNLRTQGYSGYLTELLVLEYGGVRPVLRAAADWDPPVRLDPADHGASTFGDPLVVIDPTDPNRNVAAVVSPDNVARFQHHARQLLADPGIGRFEVHSPEPLTQAECETHLARRATTPYAVRFPTPDLVDDQLYPQLRTSVRGIADGLDRRGFDTVRSTSFAGSEAVLYFEVAVPERPAIERHRGPPVHVAEHAEAFLDQYADADVYGPFIEGDRYVVERPREYRSARAFLESEALLDTGLGKDIRRRLAEGYEVLAGEDITALLPAFGRALRTFYEPSP